MSGILWRGCLRPLAGRLLRRIRLFAGSSRLWHPLVEEFPVRHPQLDRGPDILARTAASYAWCPVRTGVVSPLPRQPFCPSAAGPASLAVAYQIPLTQPGSLRGGPAHVARGAPFLPCVRQEGPAPPTRPLFLSSTPVLSDSGAHPRAAALFACNDSAWLPW